MIPANFSLTRRSIEFIYGQRDTATKQPLVRFAQREIVTRTVGATLPVLLALDFAIHSLGAVEATFYSIYKGLLKHKRIDFTLPIKHFKCLKLFMGLFPASFFIGILSPKIETFAKVERGLVTSLRGLLLSRDRLHFTPEHHIDETALIYYIQSLVKKLDVKDKTGMEDTLALLEDTKKLRKEFDRLENQGDFQDAFLSGLLGSRIKALLKRDSNLIERILIKECLTRLLALGLSVASAIDVVVHVLFVTLFNLEFVLLDILFFQNRYFKGDIKEIGLFFLYHLRDIALSIVGAIGGTAAGVISPRLGCDIATPNSGFYDRIRFSSKDIYKSVVDKVKKLADGKSLLIPVSIPYGYADKGANHFVTVLVKRESNEYAVSIINKGFQTNVVNQVFLGFKPSGRQNKIPINVTYKNVSMSEVDKYIRRLISTICASEDEIVDKVVKVVNQTQYPLEDRVVGYLTSCIYIIGDEDEVAKDASDELLYCKAQTSGDCPKASLLGALHYHSWEKNGSSKSYKQWLHRLKARALKDDANLLDIAFDAPVTKQKPSVAAKIRLHAAKAKLAAA